MQSIGARRATNIRARATADIGPRPTQPDSTTSGDAFPDDPGLKSLRPSAIWAFLKRQPLSFWFVLLYVFVEYVRPQLIYERIQGPPYARIAVIIALIAFLWERRPIRYRAPEVWLTVFSLILVMSSITAFEPSASYEKFYIYFSWIIIYVLIANVVVTEGRFLVFTLLFLIYSFKMSQFATRAWAHNGFAFRDWGVSGAPGFFENSGEFGIQMCIFLPLIVSFILGLRDNWPRWMRWTWWAVAATAVLGIVASSSRGALVGLAAVGLWMLMRSRHRFRALVPTLMLAALVYAITPAEQKARLASMGQDRTSLNRTRYWKHGLEIMTDYPVLGIGYANWPEYHEINYGVRALPHNIFIEAGAELGYTGLAAFLALIGCTFVLNRSTRRLANQIGERGRFVFYMAQGLDGALVGFIASGFFVTVLYYPFFWINFAMTVALNNVARSAIAPEQWQTASKRASGA